ncbi:hypothetical protein [Oenococcus oeni]|uniref:Uncharacterized protein n=1 Tax=Oenococcus oeni TaxID=1247 RepID=A0AAJ2P2R2_OENOE|nr:hypothetical protein [Oenococcus oeni]MDV7714598.1 hypothetical protein [Oenococcus oeni]
MNKLYLTLGSKDYLLKLSDQNEENNLQLISKPGQSQFGILSQELLKGSSESIELNVKHIITDTRQDTRLIAFYYFVGEDKQAEIAEKTLTLNQNKLSQYGASGVVWLQESKDLHRYVLKTEFNDAISYQHFTSSQLLMKLISNFYSSFNVLYTKGLDED